jgi:hypothetical protein
VIAAKNTKCSGHNQRSKTDLVKELFLENRKIAICEVANIFFFFFFLRRYNFREVSAFSTNSFHLVRFLMQSF